MTLNVEPVHPTFGGRVSGLMLRDVHDEPTLAAIRAAMDQYAVLIFPGQAFSHSEQLEFAERLDGVIHRKTGSRAIKKNRLGDEGITDISNVGADDEIMEKASRARLYSLGNRLWHTDASFEDPPGRYSMLHAKHIPEVRADTQFADTRTAYDDLSDSVKGSLRGLTVHHSIAYSRHTLGFSFSEEEAALLPGAHHPLVREFANTSRKALYLASHAAQVMEMSMPDGRLLIRDLMEHATQPKYVYQHEWTRDDLVIWDNRASMHRAMPFDDENHRRELVRVTTLDIAA